MLESLTLMTTQISEVKSLENISTRLVQIIELLRLLGELLAPLRHQQSLLPDINSIESRHVLTAPPLSPVTGTTL